MHLTLQNAETIDRLVEEGELLLKAFHAEREEDSEGWNTEFVLGELVGWRNTLHILYRDYAEDIVARVVARTDLTFPEGEVPNSAAHAD